MKDAERLSAAARYLNGYIHKMSKKFDLNNAEIVGITQAIIIALVQCLYKKSEPKL